MDSRFFLDDMLRMYFNHLQDNLKSCLQFYTPQQLNVEPGIDPLNKAVLLRSAWSYS